jgi:hypothetical protein|tara:strand:- start:2251 stop:2520 length:270 start_codon:yes stop_codon:yes gene_type:complete
MDIKKRTLTKVEEASLKDAMSSVQDWVDGAITGKINNCKKRMCKKWREILYADESVTQIPSNDDELVLLVIARDDYKTKAEQEAKMNPE